MARFSFGVEYDRKIVIDISVEMLEKKSWSFSSIGICI